MTLYNSIGKQYSLTRQPDQRIVNRLLELLNLPEGKIIADIGAGTGNYSQAIALQQQAGASQKFIYIKQCAMVFQLLRKCL